MPLLEGLDGVNKMSKSLGNYVGITDYAAGHVRQADVDFRRTDVALPGNYCHSAAWAKSPAGGEEVSAGRNPRDIKVLLAQEIVARFHSKQAAEAALAEFEARFRQGVLPDDMPEISVASADGHIGIAQLLKHAGLVPSTSEALRMIEQGGVNSTAKKPATKRCNSGGCGRRGASRQAQVRRVTVI